MNTNMFTEVGGSFANSTQMLWAGLLSILPQLLFAVLVLVAGLVLTVFLGKITKKVVAKLKLDKILISDNLRNKLKEKDVNFSIADIFGWIVKWFVVVAVLLTVSDLLNLNVVSSFLERILLYVPNILVAVVVLVIGLVVGNFVAEIVEKSLDTSEVVSFASGKVMALIAKWVIVIFAVMTALTQLNIAPGLIQILFTGIMAMFAIAGGVAFGLGGKEHAKRFLDGIFNKNDSQQE